MLHSDLKLVMDKFDRPELKEAAERKVLTYLTALKFDQNAVQWARERGLILLPIPALNYDSKNPGKSSTAILIDFDNSDPAFINGNYMMPLHGNYLIKTRVEL